ncbi:MAG: hypothetical protein M3P96_06000 [Actinomycetota bacterium]|nr:hypothetical protein [Actinomycetota bacterium]
MAVSRSSPNAASPRRARRPTVLAALVLLVAGLATGCGDPGGGGGGGGGYVAQHVASAG